MTHIAWVPEEWVGGRRGRAHRPRRAPSRRGRSCSSRGRTRRTGIDAGRVAVDVLPGRRGPRDLRRDDPHPARRRARAGIRRASSSRCSSPTCPCSSAGAACPPFGDVVRGADRRRRPADRRQHRVAATCRRRYARAREASSTASSSPTSRGRGRAAGGTLLASRVAVRRAGRSRSPRPPRRRYCSRAGSGRGSATTSTLEHEPADLLTGVYVDGKATGAAGRRAASVRAAVGRARALQARSGLRGCRAGSRRVMAEPQIVGIGGGGDTRRADENAARHVLSLTGKERPRVMPRPHRDGRRSRGDRRELRASAAASATSRTCASFPTRRTTCASSCSRRTRSTSAAATPRTCSRSGACTASTRFCARRGSAGIVLSGVSAGMICWFEAGVTDSFGPAARRDARRARLPRRQRVPALRRRGTSAGRATASSSTSGFPAGIAADDGVGLHYVGTELREIVTCRPGATAYRVTRDGEERLDARELTA